MQENNDSIHNLRVLYKKTDSLNWKSIRTYNTSIENWVKKEVSLPDLSSSYQIAFEGVGLGGYGICIDSVSISEDYKFVDPVFAINKDTICINDSIEFSTETDISNDFYWDFGSSAIPNTAIGSGPHWVKYTSAGIKPAQLIVNDTYVKMENEVAVVSEVNIIPDFSNIGNELISISENGNQWYLNGSPIEGAINNSYTIEEDGNYSVEVKNSYNCISISESKYMVLNSAELIIEDEITDNFKVYPNPNRGSFTIQMGNVDNGQLDYKIIDIAGKIQQSGKIEPYEKSKNINLVNPNEGVYFIQIYSSKNYFTSKILIKK